MPSYFSSLVFSCFNCQRWHKPIMGDIQQYCDALLLEIGSTNYEFIISCLKHFIYPIPKDIHIQYSNLKIFAPVSWSYLSINYILFNYSYYGLMLLTWTILQLHKSLVKYMIIISFLGDLFIRISLSQCGMLTSYSQPYIVPYDRPLIQILRLV